MNVPGRSLRSVDGALLVIPRSHIVILQPQDCLKKKPCLLRLTGYILSSFLKQYFIEKCFVNI